MLSTTKLAGRADHSLSLFDILRSREEWSNSTPSNVRLFHIRGTVKFERWLTSATRASREITGVIGNVKTPLEFAGMTFEREVSIVA